MSEERVPTHVCLDCGALGHAGGYHDHGGGNAGDTIPLSSLPMVIRSFQRIEDEARELREERQAASDPDPLRLQYERRCDELRELLRDGGVIDGFGDGYRDRALLALRERREASAEERSS